MNAPVIWLQTGTSRAFDLLHPTAAMVDLDIVVAEGLARQPRWLGQPRSAPFSVAQHCVMGADALWRETGRDDIAAAFLLHDAHEAYIGDIATPVAQALAQLGGAQVPRAIAWLKQRIDRATHEAAGLPFPLDPEVAQAVKVMDLRMARTEFNHLLGEPARPLDAALAAARPIRLVGKLKAWPWPDAADQYRARLRRYLPGLAAPGHRPHPKPGPQSRAPQPRTPALTEA